MDNNNSWEPPEHFEMNVYVLLSLHANAQVAAAWTEGNLWMKQAICSTSHIQLTEEKALF